MDYIWRKRGGKVLLYRSFDGVILARCTIAPALLRFASRILSLSFALFSAKICLHLRGRNFLIVARRVVVRYSTRRILMGLHRRCVANGECAFAYRV